jgi:putative ABC transport system permease protein
VNILRIAIRNITGNIVKSLTIFFCVLGVAGFFVAMTLIIGGSRNSLDRGLERLGADILVLPAGAEAKVESALLMGKPTQAWMPESNLKQTASISGVEQVSPQIYLESMFGSSCCAVWEMFMVAYDPATDFTVTPFLQKKLGRGLEAGEAIGGTYIFVPEGDEYIKIYGYNLDLKGANRDGARSNVICDKGYCPGYGQVIGYHRGKPVKDSSR